MAHYLRKYRNKEQRRKYYREYMKTQRKEYRSRLRQIKLDAGCADCGFNSHAEALDFDHRDPAKKNFNIGKKAYDRAWETVLAEIAKCDVVCANCHRIRHGAAA